MEVITDIITVVTSVVCIASIVCSLTDTPKDDALIARLYKILEIAALNIGKAKQSSAEVKPVEIKVEPHAQPIKNSASKKKTRKSN